MQCIKAIGCSLVLLLLFATLPAQDSLKRMPPAKLQRVSSIDMQHISIDLRFNWKKKQAYGKALLTFTFKKATDKIVLDACSLSVKSILSITGDTLPFQYDKTGRDGALEISVGQTMKAGDSMTVSVEYHTNYINETDPNNIGGSNGKGIRFFEPSSTEPNRRKQIWAMGEPEGNRYWFPCFDAPGDLRTTTFSATVEKNFTVISNGVLLSEKLNTDGLKTYVWNMDEPYANHLTSFVIGEYLDVAQQYKKIRLHSFGYPDEKDAVEASVERLPDMMRFFKEKTGKPFPYKNYSQVFVQELPNWFGSAGFSMITENMIDDLPTHADFFYLWDLTEAEALASQWFGANISCSNWSDAWLSKAFARYFSGLYSEYKNGRDEFLLYQLLYDHNTIYLGDRAAGICRPLVTNHYTNTTAFVGDNYPYFHGATVLHLLRKQLGEEKWDKAIKLYTRSNGGKAVSTADFVQAIETATGEKIGWFFDQWVYKMGHPVFEIEKKYDAQQKRLVLRVKQVQKMDSLDEYPQAGFFQGKVEIQIDGKVDQVWIAPQFENVFSFKLDQDPVLVHFDYQSAWVKEMIFEKPLEELLYQLQNDKDILGRQWALGELMNLARNETATAASKEKIKQGMRNVIAGKSYWRLRFNVLLQLRGMYGSLTAAETVPVDSASIHMLLGIIQNETSWLRSSAISFLGLTRDQQYAALYKRYLHDESERVVNAAAIALGKTKDASALDALIKLKDKPSWKNQRLISTLNGLKELNDPRGFDMAIHALMDSRSPHWTLATPVWDHRLAAANTLVALGQEQKAYPLIWEQFKKALEENNLNDIFYNALQVSILADVRGEQVFDMLKEVFKDNDNAMMAVNMYEAQFKNNLKKK